MTQLQESDFEPLSQQDIDHLENFGVVSIPPYMSRIIKQLYEIQRPRKIKVKRKTLMNGFPLYELEYGVGVVVKNNTGMWLIRPSAVNECC